MRSLVLMAAVALSGCSGTPSSPLPASSTLAGTWRIGTIQLAGQQFIIGLPGEVSSECR